MGIFERRRAAEACVRALHDSGFDGSQVGFTGPGVITATPIHTDPIVEDALAAAATGSLAGGVVGGVLGAVVAGLMPGIGPIIAGGMLAGLVAGAPAGAGIGSIGAALKAAGLTPPLADYCEDQVRNGRFLVTTRGGPSVEAAGIVARCGGRIEGHLGRAVSQVTGTAPEAPTTVEGSFASEAVAEAVADQLRAAFPDRVVTVEDGDAPHRVKVRRRR